MIALTMWAGAAVIAGLVIVMLGLLGLMIGLTGEQHTDTFHTWWRVWNSLTEGSMWAIKIGFALMVSGVALAGIAVLVGGWR